MAFMQKLLAQNIPIWDDCAETPFLRELQQGTLPLEKFRTYIVQDSIYLKNYARLYGKMIWHSRALRDIQVYYGALNFVTEMESAVRLGYLKRFEMTDSDIEDLEPLPENQEYIDFMMSIGEGGNVQEMLMAALPCMLSYSYIFRKLLSSPDGIGAEYADFIEDYAEDGYLDSCRGLEAFAEEKCCMSTREEKEKLGRIFEKGSLLERRFWEMAYGGRI